MIRSLLGLLLRQTVAASIGSALVLMFVLVLLPHPDVLLAILPGVFRVGLACWVCILLFLEVPRLRAQLDAREELLQQQERSPPKRPERVFETWTATFTLFAALTVAFIARKIWTGGNGTTNVEFFFALLTIRRTLWLLTGAYTRLRFWSATRRLPTARQVRSAFPLLVGTQAAIGIGLALFRLPYLPFSKYLLLLFTAGLQAGLDSQGIGQVEVLVELGPDDHPSELAPILVPHAADIKPATPNASPSDSIFASNTYVITAPAVLSPLLWQALEKDDENIQRIELNTFVQPISDTLASPCDTPLGIGPSRDPLSGGQSALRETRADRVLQRASQVPYGLVPSRLAVIDTGVDAEHEDLRGVVLGRSHGDRLGHGTAIAGIAAAVGNNGIGIASINDGGHYVQILDYPALEGSLPTADDVAQAVFKAVDDGASVIVMAFSARGRAPRLMEEAVRHARERDVVLIAAAGNDGPTGHARDRWPANMDGVLVVTGLDGGQLANFSNRGGDGSVSAPSRNVCAPTPGGGYRQQTGTSMAAALVAGAVARRRAQCSMESERSTLEVLWSTSSINMERGRYTLRVDALLDVPCGHR